MDKNNSIEKFVNDELIKPTLDLSIDYAELILDDLLDNDILKSIPIIKTGALLYNSVLKIKEAFNIKKLLVFLQAFRKGQLSNDEINEFQNKFINEVSYKNKVIEQIILMNERFISIEKSKIYANLFLAHVKSLLEWNDLMTLTAVLDTMNLKALPALKAFGKTKEYGMNIVSYDSVFFLLASGLAIKESGTLLNSYGVYFYHYGVMADFTHNSHFHKNNSPFYKGRTNMKDLIE